MRGFAYFAAAAAACVLAACSSPANVAGNYTVDLTDEANGCNLSNFTQGQSTSGVSVSITQKDSDVTVAVTGVAGAYLMTVLGSSTFDGSVSGDGFDAKLIGTTAGHSSNCTFTFDADLHGDLAKDSISGTIDYTPQTNGSPDCSTIMGCTSTQNFSGTRPPQ
jgi:hypothetical protein|nr:hypothetical protein [Kofleriaceae bacterium]